MALGSQEWLWAGNGFGQPGMAFGSSNDFGKPGMAMDWACLWAAGMALDNRELLRAGDGFGPGMALGWR